MDKTVEILNSIEFLIKDNSFIFPVDFLKKQPYKASEMIMQHLQTEYGIFIYEYRNGEKGYFLPADIPVKYELLSEAFEQWFRNLVTELCLPDKCLTNPLEFNNNAAEIKESGKLTKQSEVATADLKNRIKSKIMNDEDIDVKSCLKSFSDLKTELQEDKSAYSYSGIQELANACIGLINDNCFPEDRIVTFAEHMFNLGYQIALADMESTEGRFKERSYADRAVTSLSRGYDKTMDNNSQSDLSNEMYANMLQEYFDYRIDCYDTDTAFFEDQADRINNSRIRRKERLQKLNRPNDAEKIKLVKADSIRKMFKRYLKKNPDMHKKFIDFKFNNKIK